MQDPLLKKNPSILECIGTIQTLVLENRITPALSAGCLRPELTLGGIKESMTQNFVLTTFIYLNLSKTNSHMGAEFALEA